MFGCHFRIFGFTLALVSVSGCGQPPGNAKPNHEAQFGDGAFVEATDADAKADAPAPKGSYKSLGEIKSGATKTFYHSGSPNFRSYYFDGKSGDDVTIDVSAEDGDSEIWLVDASTKTVGYNDDKSSTSYDSEIKAKLPATGRYRILMQEYGQWATTFTVTFKSKAASSGGGTTTPPNYFSCTRDSDCVAITNPACCQSWTHVAVAKSKQSAYVTAAQCQQASPSCATPPNSDSDAARTENAKVAECNAGACVMIHPDNINCGGTGISAHACPSPYQCIASPDGGTSPGDCDIICSYNGDTYYPGDTWKTDDLCNDCSCASNGVASCTKKTCPVCDYTTTATHRYKVQSAAQCGAAFFLCKVGEVRFDDACGCGCQKG